MTQKITRKGEAKKTRNQKLADIEETKNGKDIEVDL